MAVTRNFLACESVIILRKDMFLIGPPVYVNYGNFHSHFTGVPVGTSPN
jgi:hypothetical protein